MYALPGTPAKLHGLLASTQLSAEPTGATSTMSTPEHKPFATGLLVSLADVPLYFYIYKPRPDTWFPILTSSLLGPGTTATTSGQYATPSSVSDSSVSASPPPPPTPLLCVDWLHGLDLTDQKHVSFDINSYLENREELYNNCQQQPCPHTHQSIPQVRYYFWEGEHSIILPSNPALLHFHFLRLAFSHLLFFGPESSTSTVPSPDITHTPLPLSAPPSAIPTARPSPTLIPNPSPLPVSPAPLSPIASPITDIDMSSTALENLLQALVNNQNQLQQAITNLVNRPTHESSDKTAKPAPFKGEPAKLDSFLSLFILWAGEQKRLKLDSGKLDPQKCIAEALLMMEGPAAEWAAEYARHISRVRADEAGAVFPWEGNWDSFTHTLKVRFGVANEQQLAKNKLELLKQGDKTVAEFSQIFKMWAEKTGFSDQDLQYKFRKRLHKDLKYGARTEGGP
ncbi:hypothetical protein D9758_007009 [Tetrapyrgos nigripes]|uniref:Retrotransposon gag domain-containing protein n=1 Tax=Tetrapyrgos nigripes TaxID=182062 RepID=A0A8H5GSP6_9AGAR|nr:hypothetical protein D9758_007009 [Tetrapyrgos nigripes]